MSAQFRSYRDLKVWQLGMELSRTTYAVTRTVPADEKFGLVSQMRRAAVSIPSNIVEGHARGTPGEFQRFVCVALGVLAELETQVILSQQLNFMSETESQNILVMSNELGKMLRGLQKSLNLRKQ